MAGLGSRDEFALARFSIAAFGPKILLGDVNLDGVVNLLDVQPFVVLISNGGFQVEADINQDGFLNLLDVEGFVDLISGN